MRLRNAAVCGIMVLCVHACASDPDLPIKRSKRVPDAGPPPSAADAVCLMTRTAGLGGDKVAYDYIRYAYDAEARVLSQDWSRDPELANIHLSERSLLDEAGRLLITTARDFHNEMSWRFDRTLDEHGNVLESLATYTDDLEFSHEPEGRRYSEQHYEHVYDDAGRLSESFVRGTVSFPPFDHFRYESLPDGSCERVVAEGGDERSTETFAYDGERASGSTVEQKLRGLEAELRTVLRYDDAGRIEAVEEDGDEHNNISADGQPDVLQSYEYAADGAVTITWLDYNTDTPNEEVDRDGEKTWVYRSVITRSPECARLSERIDREHSTACSSGASLVPDPLEPW